MKKAIAVVFSLMFVLTLTVASFAADKKDAVKHVMGEVTAVDSNAKSLTVKSKKVDVVISVDDKTKIMAGKDKKTLADVKAGDRVAVRYTEADGKNTAKSISIHAAPAKMKEKAPAAEKK